MSEEAKLVLFCERKKTRQTKTADFYNGSQEFKSLETVHVSKLSWNQHLNDKFKRALITNRRIMEKTL